MNPSNVYWQAPKQFYEVNFYDTIKPNNLGFLKSLPYPDPVQTPFYYGEGRNYATIGDKTLYKGTFPETYAVQNVLPSTGGIPRMNPDEWWMKYSRKSSKI